MKSVKFNFGELNSDFISGELTTGEGGKKIEDKEEKRFRDTSIL